MPNPDFILKAGPIFFHPSCLENKAKAGFGTVDWEFGGIRPRPANHIRNALHGGLFMSQVHAFFSEK